MCQGLVLESRWDHGRQEPVGQLTGPGGLIDPAAALQQPSRGAVTATTLTETTLIFLPQPLVNRCLQHSPQIMRKLLGYLCAQLHLLEVRYYLRSSCDVYARVAHTLLWMADQIGRVSADSVTIPLKCDRRVLAQLVGASPETVSRMISRLREENLVECRDNSIDILNPAQLSQGLVDAVMPGSGKASTPPVTFPPCTAP
ncbi:MAG: Crp/Fnr family transcriptional regulator [Nitrospiraceae bacterium]|nr:Crp/Fnr family transcriptional regulator [Nitrospiraceae bacterium]